MYLLMCGFEPRYTEDVPPTIRTLFDAIDSYKGKEHDVKSAVKKIDRILTENKGLINSIDAHGNTSLVHACSRRLHPRFRGIWFGPVYEIVNLLLQHGASPNARNNAGRTALHAACEFKQSCSRIQGRRDTFKGSEEDKKQVLKVIRKLIKCGGDLRLQDGQRKSPLDYARCATAPPRYGKPPNKIYERPTISSTLKTADVKHPYVNPKDPPKRHRPVQRPVRAADIQRMKKRIELTKEKERSILQERRSTERLLFRKTSQTSFKTPEKSKPPVFRKEMTTIFTRPVQHHVGLRKETSTLSLNVPEGPSLWQKPIKVTKSYVHDGARCRQNKASDVLWVDQIPKNVFLQKHEVPPEGRKLNGRRSSQAESIHVHVSINCKHPCGKIAPKQIDAGRKVETPIKSDPVQYVMNKKDSDLTDDEFKYKRILRWLIDVEFERKCHKLENKVINDVKSEKDISHNNEVATEMTIQTIRLASPAR